MGVLDTLFGRKVTIQGHDESGKPVEKKVSKRQLEEWEKEGKIRKVDAIEVHVLDPKGNYSAHWIVGKDIAADLVEKFRDPESGALYALTVYKSGEPETMIATRAKWLEVKAAMGE